MGTVGGETIEQVVTHRGRWWRDHGLDVRIGAVIGLGGALVTTEPDGLADDLLLRLVRSRRAGQALREACADLPLVFHNAPFDLPFLLHLFREAGAPSLLNPIVDTLGLARGLFGTGSNSLGPLAQKLGVPAETAHRALGDTRMTARVFVELAGRWERDKGVRSLLELAAISQDVMRATARR